MFTKRTLKLQEEIPHPWTSHPTSQNLFLCISLTLLSLRYFTPTGQTRTESPHKHLRQTSAHKCFISLKQWATQRQFADRLLTSAFLTRVLCFKENVPPVIPSACCLDGFSWLRLWFFAAQILIVCLPSSDLPGSGDPCAARCWDNVSAVKLHLLLPPPLCRSLLTSSCHLPSGGADVSHQYQVSGQLLVFSQPQRVLWSRLVFNVCFYPPPHPPHCEVDKCCGFFPLPPSLFRKTGPAAPGRF